MRNNKVGLYRSLFADGLPNVIETYPLIEIPNTTAQLYYFRMSSSEEGIR